MVRRLEFFGNIISYGSLTHRAYEGYQAVITDAIKIFIDSGSDIVDRVQCSIMPRVEVLIFLEVGVSREGDNQTNRSLLERSNLIEGTQILIPEEILFSETSEANRIH